MDAYVISMKHIDAHGSTRGQVFEQFVTTAIISMAKSLHLKVIAEGVEDEAQMLFLRAHQCDEIQGYYFSKPLAVERVADKLRGDISEPNVRAQASGGQS